MAYALHVYIVNPDDEKIYVEHIFYGLTEAAARKVKQEHLESCEYFKAAEEDGRTDEWCDEIPKSQMPVVDQDASNDEAIDV